MNASQGSGWQLCPGQGNIISITLSLLFIGFSFSLKGTSI